MLYMFRTLLVHHQEQTFISCTSHLVCENTSDCCVVEGSPSYIWYMPICLTVVWLKEVLPTFGIRPYVSLLCGWRKSFLHLVYAHMSDCCVVEGSPSNIWYMPICLTVVWLKEVLPTFGICPYVRMLCGCRKSFLHLVHTHMSDCCVVVGSPSNIWYMLICLVVVWL